MPLSPRLPRHRTSEHIRSATMLLQELWVIPPRSSDSTSLVRFNLICTLETHLASDEARRHQGKIEGMHHQAGLGNKSSDLPQRFPPSSTTPTVEENWVCQHPTLVVVWPTTRVCLVTRRPVHTKLNALITRNERGRMPLQKGWR